MFTLTNKIGVNIPPVVIKDNQRTCSLDQYDTLIKSLCLVPGLILVFINTFNFSFKAQDMF